MVSDVTHDDNCYLDENPVCVVVIANVTIYLATQYFRGRAPPPPPEAGLRQW